MRTIITEVQNAFTHSEFERILVYMNKNAELSTKPSITDYITDVMAAAKREGWLLTLLINIIAERPQSTELRQAIEKYITIARQSEPEYDTMSSDDKRVTELYYAVFGTPSGGNGLSRRVAKLRADMETINRLLYIILSLLTIITPPILLIAWQTILR